MNAVHEAARPPDFADVVAAAGRLQPWLKRTPLISSDELDALCGRRVFLKCENWQHGRSFKYRGALNALLVRPRSTAGIAVGTHSSGNHGTALALAARSLGIDCHVVVPRDAASVKVDNVRAAGARVWVSEPGLDAREKRLAALQRQFGLHLVHPFDDARVIAGAGTAALEMLAERPDLAVLAAPIGGGGLIGGTTLAVCGAATGCRVVAAEPAAADDAYRSFRSGERQRLAGPPDTIADGLRGSIGALNFELLQRYVDDVVTVSEEAIHEGMRQVLRLFGMLIEPSSAVPVAAALAGRIGAPGECIGIILSGGNVDFSACPFLAGSPLSNG